MTEVKNSKTCTKCKTEKSLHEFSPAKKGYLGRNSTCKKCSAEATKARYSLESQAARRALSPCGKQCITCKLDFPWHSFYVAKYSTDGYLPWCKACHGARDDRSKAGRRAQRERDAAKQGRQLGLTSAQERELRELLATYEEITAKAEDEATKAWRKYRLEIATDAWLTEYYAASGKPWTNPRLSKAEEYKVRIRHDMDYRLSERIRMQIKKQRRRGDLQWVVWRALRDGGNSPTMEQVLGYSAAQLRKHIERQFTTGMTWEKFAQGEIHLDHRVPVSSFDLTNESQLRACWALTNLQPLWASENIAKSDNRTLLL